MLIRNCAESISVVSERIFVTFGQWDRARSHRTVALFVSHNFTLFHNIPIEREANFSNLQPHHSNSTLKHARRHPFLIRNEFTTMPINKKNREKNASRAIKITWMRFIKIYYFQRKNPNKNKPANDHSIRKIKHGRTNLTKSFLSFGMLLLGFVCWFFFFGFFFRFVSFSSFRHFVEKTVLFPSSSLHSALTWATLACD